MGGRDSRYIKDFMYADCVAHVNSFNSVLCNENVMEISQLTHTSTTIAETAIDPITKPIKAKDQIK